MHLTGEASHPTVLPTAERGGRRLRFQMYIYTIRPLCLEALERSEFSPSVSRTGLWTRSWGCVRNRHPLLSADPAGVYYTCALYKRRVRALLGEMVMTEIYETRVHYIIYLSYILYTTELYTNVLLNHAQRCHRAREALAHEQDHARRRLLSSELAHVVLRWRHASNEVREQ